MSCCWMTEKKVKRREIEARKGGRSTRERGGADEEGRGEDGMEPGGWKEQQ